MAHQAAMPEDIMPSLNNQKEFESINFYGVSIWTLMMTAGAMVTATVVLMSIYANWTTNEGTSTKKVKERDPNLPAPSKVVSLYVYPIKSCRGIQVKSCKLKKTGLDLDRNWMFVDAEKREFLTIRSDPSMTLIDTVLEGPDSDSGEWNKLNVSIHGTDDRISVPCYPTEKWLSENCTIEQVEIWGEKTDAWRYSDEINSIFARFFGKPVWLVYKGPSPRLARGNADASLYGKEESHYFADVMSLQVASEASLDDLNRRLRERGQGELTIERFRPNIIIKGNEPWEEDRWKRVQINTTDHAREMLWRTPLDVLARCARCQVPNVNPDTAEKHLHEPWDTLMKFRRVDPGGVAKYKPCFGMLCMPVKNGWVKIGAEVEAVELTEKHLYNTAKFDEL